VSCVGGLYGNALGAISRGVFVIIRRMDADDTTNMLIRMRGNGMAHSVADAETARVIELKARIAELEDLYASTNTRVQEAHSRYTNIVKKKEDLDALRAKIQTRDDKIAQMVEQSALDAVQDELNSEKDNNIALNRENDILRADLKNIQAKNTAATKEIAHLKGAAPVTGVGATAGIDMISKVLDPKPALAALFRAELEKVHAMANVAFADTTRIVNAFAATMKTGITAHVQEKFNDVKSAGETGDIKKLRTWSTLQKKKYELFFKLLLNEILFVLTKLLVTESDWMNLKHLFNAENQTSFFEPYLLQIQSDVFFWDVCRAMMPLPLSTMQKIEELFPVFFNNESIQWEINDITTGESREIYDISLAGNSSAPSTLPLRTRVAFAVESTLYDFSTCVTLFFAATDILSIDSPPPALMVPYTDIMSTVMEARKKINGLIPALYITVALSMPYHAQCVDKTGNNTAANKFHIQPTRAKLLESDRFLLDLRKHSKAAMQLQTMQKISKFDDVFDSFIAQLSSP